jgi:predicted MFS family arabinose efflux permease
LVVSTSLVATGAVVVAVAPTFGVLLLGRVLQGPLMAFLPLEFAIVRERAGQRTGRAVGLLVGALAVGGGVAAPSSGILREYLSLSTTLWFPAVVMAITVPVALFLVPESSVRQPGPVDWAGAVLLGSGLVLLLAAVGNGSVWGWTALPTLGGILGGLALLAVWITVERRVTVPLIKLALILRGGLGLPILAGGLAGAELFGSQAASSLFMGLPRSTGFGLGLTSGQLGLVLLVFGASALLGTILSPRLAERAGSRAALATGGLLTSAGYLLVAFVHGTVHPFIVSQVLVGVGNGFVLATLSTLAVSRAPSDSVAMSAGMFNIARTVGGAVSAAVFAAVMAAIVTHPQGAGKPITSVTGYVTVWLVCAGLALSIAMLATRLPASAPGDSDVLIPEAEASHGSSFPTRPRSSA